MNRIVCVGNDRVPAGSPLQAKHGLALWVETRQGVVLFDTSAAGDVLLHNLSTLALPLNQIKAVVLSHNHDDHTGGLKALAEATPQPILPVHAHSTLFMPRFQQKNGKYNSIGIPHQQEEYPTSVEWHLSDRKLEIIPGLWRTGEITDRPEMLGTSPRLTVLVDGVHQLAPHADDLSLVLKVRDGLVLICGCCHAGLLNTLRYIRGNFQDPVIAVLGGIHLGNASGQELRHILDVLEEEYEIRDYYLNHCSGEDAMRAFQARFGARVQPFLGGMSVGFDD